MPPGEAIDVRAASGGDLDAMTAIHAASFATGWDRAALEELVATPHCIALVASVKAGARPQGFVLIRRAADEAELLTLAVLPSCRRSGLAHALVTSAASWCRAGGAERLYLEVAATNDAALGLYAGFGAIRVGERPRYYEDGADAVILSLALSPPAPDDGRPSR